VGTKNSRSEDFLLAKHTSHKHPHHDVPFSRLAAWFSLMNTPHPREPLREGLGKVAFKWFSIKLQIKGENNLFLLPLCKLQQSLTHRRQW
jgi:hypothetical protein